MALKVVQSRSSRTLFNACAAAFLDEAGVHVGPAQHPAQLWLTHRNQRDLLLTEAVRRGLGGWLNPPIHFFSALPELFGVRAKPIGLLARRELISRIGHEAGKPFGINVGNADASITRGHMLDSLLGELLAEGVAPNVLEHALAEVPGDAFAARRNAWVVASYDTYLSELQEIGVYDPRAIHALVAARIDAGGLPGALGNARRLHIYGLYSARARGRLLDALRRQADVEVIVYTTSGAADLAACADSTEALPAVDSSLIVQPAPDANRELQWVAREVKKLLLSGAAEPHEIAVVARTGREDTRRALYALERAGVPATARTRTPLSEISALKALLDLFRASAERWSYRVLRSVLASPYFRTRIDLRPFDHIASQARPATLLAWEGELACLAAALESEDPDLETRRLGLNPNRVRRDLKLFQGVRALLEPLAGEKSLGQWLELTRALLRESWFRFRQRICDPPEERRDIVRLDQRGVRMLERLLDDWSKIDDAAEVFSPTEWFRALRALLEGQELVLTTPGQKGVQVLEAHDAALMPFHTTFLVHANDGEFPRLPATTGVFSDEERRGLL
ncbi:MAG TPA: hypothetical protein VK864_00840, partial [Longimicrobiales bacterium]|nr:hypothetical protein [Longimicrobiales bacterium]